jgi:pantothenate kinase type III
LVDRGESGGSSRRLLLSHGHHDDGHCRGVILFSSANFFAEASIIGRTTETSIQSGLMFGGVEIVDGLNRRLRQEMGENTRIIATGGLAGVLMPHLKTVERVEPNLTLEGLGIIFERCA